MIRQELLSYHGDEFQSFHMSAFLDRASISKLCHLANNHEAQVAGIDRRAQRQFQSIYALVSRDQRALRIVTRQYRRVHQSGS